MANNTLVYSRIRKLRELVSFLFAGEKCFFCGRPLIEYTKEAKADDVYEITVHHLDGKGDRWARENNKKPNAQKSNLTPVHRCCHKGFHQSVEAKVRRDWADVCAETVKKHKCSVEEAHKLWSK